MKKNLNINVLFQPIHSDISFVCVSNEFSSTQIFKEFASLKKIVNSIHKNFLKHKDCDEWFYQSKNQSFILFGYDNSDMQSFEDAVALCVRKCINKKIEDCNIFIAPKNMDEVIIAIDSAISANNSFEYKQSDDKFFTKISIIICTKTVSELAVDKVLHERKIIMEHVLFCRNLVDENADIITPEILIDNAKMITKSHKNISIKTWLGEELQSINMPLIQAVGRGACTLPAFIHMDYKNEDISDDSKHIILIGKGVTYDTGGLNIKTGTGMEDMRKDMAGAATVLSVIGAISSLKIKNIHVTVLIPSAENAIGKNSYKPGDVYISRSGKYIEIVNTDAEGRLILSDAIDYACDLAKNNTMIVDIATLTGSITLALGSDCAGMFSNNNTLATKLEIASAKSMEQLWRMPLLKGLKKSIQSKRADIKNCGDRYGGSITAALFLESFVKKNIPWAHLDIAGTSIAPKRPSYRYSVSGYGVKLLIELIKLISEDTHCY